MNGPVEKRRWFPPRLQFSLRLLMLLLTAFALGFPIWYRWPYQTVVEERDPKTGKVTTKRVLTWQRQLGGKPLLHGQEQGTGWDTVTITNYVRGKKEGPYQQHNDKTGYKESGQYHNDMKEGTWITENRGVVTTWSWNEGKSHGECKIVSPKGVATELLFDIGRLTRINGKPAHDRLFGRLERGEVDQRTAAALSKDMTVDVAEMPLKDVALYLSETCSVPVVIDGEAGVAVDQPISGSYTGLSFGSLLTIVASTNDLLSDYRYGMLWITTREDADDWHDTTGVAEITPPKGSPLARAWNEPVAVEAMNMPLAAVLNRITERLAIDVDTSQVEPTAEEPGRLPFTGILRDLPFRHALGYLLYKTGCRCRLEDGQLTIVPPSEQPAQAQ